MSTTLIKTLVRAYHTLSPGTRARLAVVLSPVRMMANGYASLKFAVYWVKGEEREFFLLTSSKVDPYFIEEFCRNAEMTKTGDLYAWRVRKFIRTHTTVMIDMHKHLAAFFRDGLMTVPRVHQVLDLQIPLKDILRHVHEKTKLSAFQCTISTDRGDIKDFYDNIFVPYTLKRYPKASLLSFEQLYDKMLKNAGELLIIKKNGLTAGGACCMAGRSTYYYLINGLTDERFLKEGAMAAVYYFCIRRAKERGALTMDFGWSRPFIFGGVLSYKRKWQVTIVPDRRNRVVYLKNLKKEGLIVVEEKKFKILAFSEEHAALPRYADAGLEVKLVGPE